MTEQRTKSVLDFEVLKYAVEGLDAELLLSYYAEDAEVRWVGPGALRVPRWCGGASKRSPKYSAGHTAAR
jgi:hypothetical protein